MTRIVFLPHDELCPEGAVIEVEPGITICDAALQHGIEIEHACEKSCACTTCHVIVREGFDSMEEPDDLEEDMLDKAWGLEPESPAELPGCGGRRRVGCGDSKIHHQSGV